MLKIAILKFRDWREEFELEHASVNATDIPQPFTDLIALLAHERYIYTCIKNFSCFDIDYFFIFFN